VSLPATLPRHGRERRLGRKPPHVGWFALVAAEV